MSGFLGRLFGKKDGGEAAPAAAAEVYKDFQIHPKPTREGGGWRTGGAISKETPDGTKTHVFIRADTHTSQEDAVSFSITKAKQIIDEQGEGIFQSGS